MDIGWTIYKDQTNKNNNHWQNIVYFEPVPLWDMVLEERSGADYTMCPAVSDYFKNIFVIRCPYDVTITYDKTRQAYITDRLGQEWYNQTIYPRFPIEKNGEVVGSCMTLRIKYLFVADEDVEIESIDVPLLSTPLTRNIKVVPGIMNIHRWLRPLDFTFEVQDLNVPLELKRGEPLFAVRIKSKDKVKLKEIEYNEELQRATEACIESRLFVPRKSLKYRYEMAKRFLLNKRWL